MGNQRRRSSTIADLQTRHFPSCPIAPVPTLDHVVRSLWIYGRFRRWAVSGGFDQGRTKSLDQSTAEDYVIFQTVVTLFRALFTRRTRVRLIGVKLSSFTSDPCVQIDLFETASKKQWDRLYQGIDRIRGKYGFNSILRGTSVIRDKEG